MAEITVKVGEKDPKRSLYFKKALDGKIIVLEHPVLDIVIDPPKNKITAFAKDMLGDHVYESQERLYGCLMKAGIINYDSVRAGNVFNAMEADFLTASDNRDVLNEVLLAIKKHIDQILPYYEAMEKYEEEYEQSLLNPDGDESTELGEVPQKRSAGTLRPPYIKNTYSFFE
jgi:hypothetical protein